ncbi:putative immunity protein [Streptomyces sp. NPDC102259]|uniref:putative immunity protein n=1 Tax=Streptomyces sp. NPDC102259 TaxID=3366148 RepID=UPI003830BA25
MPTTSDKIELTEHELREIAGYAADCARRALPIFEQSLPTDPRPRDAVAAADAFARGGRRTGALRQSAWAAYRAAQEAASPASPTSSASPTAPAAVDAARAASHAAAAAYLHPLANAHQVKHILGAAAHAARAEELAAGEARPVTAGSAAIGGSAAAGGSPVGVGTLEWACHHAPAAVAAVLGRLPAAPPGGGRVGELLRALDAALRA